MKSLLVASITAAAISALVAGCGKESPVTPANTVTLSPEAGRFGLSWLKGLGKTGAAADTGAVKAGAQVNFDLGEIKGSTAFYFLLYNVGMKPITDVTLSIDDTNFRVYPAHIDTLIPGGDVGMLPIVKIEALHGTVLEGIGFRAIMPMGMNNAVLRISGSTESRSGTDTTTSMSVGLKVTALVMDFRLRVDGQRVVVNFNGEYGGKTADTTAVMCNTGNVPVDVVATHWSWALNRDLDTIVARIAVGDSFAVRLGGCQDSGSTQNLTRIHTSADNTVFSPELHFMQDIETYLYNCVYVYAPLCSGSGGQRAPIDVAPFVTLAASATCADSANLLFLVDTNMLFWDRRGTCADSAYSFTLFRSTPDTVLCRYVASIAGPVDQCSDSTYHGFLETMRTNLTDPRLGLDSTHTVTPIPF